MPALLTLEARRLHKRHQRAVALQQAQPAPGVLQLRATLAPGAPRLQATQAQGELLPAARVVLKRVEWRIREAVVHLGARLMEVLRMAVLQATVAQVAPRAVPPRVALERRAEPRIPAGLTRVEPRDWVRVEPRLEV